MNTHQVQIDDEVFQFVKTHAEPLVDDFNSTLRRLLALKGVQPQARHSGTSSPQSNNEILPSLPRGTPIALVRILEIVHLVQSGAYTRKAATQFVAKHHKVFTQTIIDKYCRQLGLTANQFDRLLEEKNFGGLRRLLKTKFGPHSDVIDQLLK